MGDTVTMTCSVTFTGDQGWAPKIEWTDPNGVINDVIDESSGNTVQVSVRRSAELSMNGYVYSAKVYFGPYEGVLPGSYASNIPAYTYTHTFEPLRIAREFELGSFHILHYSKLHMVSVINYWHEFLCSGPVCGCSISNLAHFRHNQGTRPSEVQLGPDIEKLNVLN